MCKFCIRQLVISYSNGSLPECVEGFLKTSLLKKSLYSYWAPAIHGTLFKTYPLEKSSNVINIEALCNSMYKISNKIEKTHSTFQLLLIDNLPKNVKI